MDYSSTIVSIKKDLLTAETPLHRLRLKVSLARFTHYNDRKESLKLVQELESEVQRVQDEFVHGWYWYNRGWHSYEAGEQLLALEEFQKSHEYFLLINDETGLEGKAASLGGQANCYYGLGDINNALPMMLDTLTLADKGGDRRLAGATSQNIGAIYIKMKKYPQAREFLEQARQIFLSTGESHFLIPLYLNMAVSYREEGFHAQAHDWFEKVYDLDTPGSNPHFLCESLVEQGVCYFQEKKYPQAGECLTKGYKIAQAHGFSALRKQLELLDAQINVQTGNLDKAQTLWEASLRDETSSPEWYLLLSEIAEKREDYRSALNYYRQYILSQNRQEGEDSPALFADTRIRMAEDSRKKVQVISDIGKKITANLNLEQISLSIYESLSELMGADVFGIGLLGEEGLTFPLFKENHGTMPGFTIPPNSSFSFAFWAINNRRTIIINDLDKERENYVEGIYTPRGINSEEEKKIESLIYVPLVYNENPIGVLTVQSYRKGNFSLSHINLLEALESFVAIAVENARKTKELEYLSGIDYLTGIANRRRLDEYYKEISQVCRRNKSSLTLLLLDIDRFKRFNDDHGHDMGDRCLTFLAKLIRNTLHRPLDKLGRFGGEEFMIILGETNEKEGRLIAEKLRSTIEASPLVVGNESLPITVSIGGVTLHDPELYELMASPWLKKADIALYEAKNAGRNRVRWGKA